MSSQSSTTTTGLGRRSAAALGASAVLSLALAGPALAQEPFVPGTNQASAHSPSDCRFSGGSIPDCRAPKLLPKESGAGSVNSAERATPVRKHTKSRPPAAAAPSAPKIIVPQAQPTNVPIIAIGTAAAAVLAGGLALVAANRRRPA